MDKIDLSIQNMMSKVFNVDSELINLESGQDNLDNWDSLRHLDFVVAVEEEFDIVFPIEEIGNLTSFKLISIIVREQLESGNLNY
jgi:acyl carrier protein